MNIRVLDYETEQAYDAQTFECEQPFPGMDLLIVVVKYYRNLNPEYGIHNHFHLILNPKKISDEQVMLVVEAIRATEWYGVLRAKHRWPDLINPSWEKA